MADPLSLLSKKKKEEAPKPAAAAPATSSATGSKTSSLFDVESALGCSKGDDAVLSVSERIQQALRPSTNVDFPMVTEICEALNKEPGSTSEAVRLLCSAFAEVNGSGRKKLKALTLTHELCFNPSTAQEVKKVPGARDALWELQSWTGSSLGRDADAQIRMFATEVEKTCFGSAGDPFVIPDAPAARSSAHPAQAPALSAHSKSNLSDPLQKKAADPFEPTFLTPPATSSAYPADARQPIDWGTNRSRKRDEAMSKLWDFGSSLKEGLDSVSSVAKRNLAAVSETAKASLGVPSESMPRPDIPKLPVRPEADRPILNITFDGILAGEKVNHAVKADMLISNPFCEVPGRLLATSYRLKFQVQKGSLRSELAWLQEKQVMDVPLGLIEDIKLECPQSQAGVPQWRIRIITKDGRVLLVIVQEPQDLVAVEEHVSALAMPGEHFTPCLFAYKHAQERGYEPDGWDLYNPEAEFSRMGVDTNMSPSPSSPWCMTQANRDYALCSSYPSWLVRPRSITDAQLSGVARFRKRGRLPVLSWCGGPSCNYASLWRCSQPTDGILGNASTEDEKLVQAIHRGAGSSSDRGELLTLDLRTKNAAYANKVGGGGYESYSNCNLVFGNIDNVHGVREAWRAMGKAASSVSAVECGSWFKDVANSGWYDILGAVMYCVAMVVDELDTRKRNAMIHCSDGWDRTAQVSSLVMLCMDPHYRTLRGFLILIQKEFCSFGHRFRTRLGNGEQPTGEYSPIFVQWLEAVHQLTVQFPEAFEFSESLLLFIVKEVFTNRFGTFLADNEKERQDVSRKTLSLWSAILKAGPAGPDPDHINPNYNGTAGVLRLSPSQINYKIWEEYWFRYILHPRDDNS